MIVSVFGPANAGIGTQVARNLAVLRARVARKILLVDASPAQASWRWAAERAREGLRPAVTVETLRGTGCGARLERLLPRDTDAIIDTDGCGAHDCRWALIAARIALVPLAPDDADIERCYAWIAALNSAHMFNPGLQVLFATVAGDRHPSLAQLRALRLYASQVMAARLATTTLRLPALDEATGLHDEVYGVPCASRPLHTRLAPTSTTTRRNTA